MTCSSSVLIGLKNGQTATINFTVLNSDGSARDLNGFTVTMSVAGGKGVKFNRAATLNSPNTLGTGYFSIVRGDYDINLKPAKYDFEIWLSNGDGANDLNIPVLSGIIDVTSVPQRI
jgi:hypothetical protein